MATSATSHPGQEPSTLSRSAEGRVLAGVAAGLAHRLGVRPLAVRVALAGLTLAGGLGVLVYVAAWLLMPSPGARESIAQVALRERQDLRPVVAVGMIVLGGLLLLRQTGPWFDDAVVWPVVTAAMGLYVIWRQADSDDRASLRRVTADLPRSAVGASMRPSRVAMARVVLGVGLVTAGVGVFLAAHHALEAARDGMLATGAVVGGLALVFAPWWRRLARDLADERRERIRSQERAELAAEVHDSVLQTLTLIQRNAADPRAVTTLARRQERELRAWLYARPSRSGQNLAAALTTMGDEVEDLHGATVETVVVGDSALDERLGALVQATREALVNAARHSGSGTVSVYSEVEPQRVKVFVRDRGKGFDVDRVPAGHGGIAESIVGRMRRHGGEAVVRSEPSHGTEVELTMPRSGP